MRTLAITTFAFLGVTLTPLLSNQATTNINRAGTSSTSRVSSSPTSQSNAGTKNQTSAKNTDTGKAANGRKVDLNTATQGELESLPGVGSATAKKIIAGRPYSSVADLSKAGVPAKTVSGLNGMVTVGTPAATSNQASSVTAKSAKQASSSPATAQAGGPGMVWVNPDTKVFHRSGSRWYGKTKTGQYMTEADAVKAGYRESKQSGSSKQ